MWRLKGWPSRAWGAILHLYSVPAWKKTNDYISLLENVTYFNNPVINTSTFSSDFFLLLPIKYLITRHQTTRYIWLYRQRVGQGRGKCKLINGLACCGSFSLFLIIRWKNCKKNPPKKASHSHQLGMIRYSSRNAKLPLGNVLIINIHKIMLLDFQFKLANITTVFFNVNVCLKST